MVSVSLTGERLASAADADGAELTGRLRTLQTRWDAVSGRLLELQRRRPAPAAATAAAASASAGASDDVCDGAEEESDGQVRMVCVFFLGGGAGVMVIRSCSLVMFECLRRVYCVSTKMAV